MPSSLPVPDNRPVACRDRALRALVGAGVLAFVLAAKVAMPAAPSGAFDPQECNLATASGGICIKGEKPVFQSRDDSWSLEKAELRDTRGTRVVASSARGIMRAGNVMEVDFTGNVHVEFRGALLDADTARMVLRDDVLVSVNVKGSQAKFSHQPDRSKRRIEGLADGIDYAAASSEVRFSGSTQWTNGSYALNAPELTYNINSQEVRAPRSTGTVRLGEERERVPAPRTPDRSTAQ